MTNEQLARFIAKVDRSGDCWVWTAQRNRRGYGRISWQARGPQSKQFAHRVAYEHWVGPIADGLVIDHLYRNRSCCNPAHLEAVTCQENISRGLTGHYERTPEHNAKVAAAKRGKARPWTPEWRAKLCAAAMRRKQAA